MKKEKTLLLLSGLLIGCIAAALMQLGNPANMGFCIACFLRDTAGALKLHGAAVVQYLRPEIIGLVLGSFFLSLLTKEFKVRGGSSPILRFSMGFMLMIGALVFLGCPFRMLLRMAAGDLNAWVGLIGFILGIACGTLFLKRGFSLKRSYPLSLSEGLIFPLSQMVLLLLLLAAPALLAFSTEGPGSQHAPLWISLTLALVVGALVQRSRLCQAGGIRDLIMFKDGTLLLGSVAIFAVALSVNLVSGRFHLGFADQPIAHTEALWNILGLFVVGLASTLLGGCPLRQLVLSGTGNTDSVVTVIGMVAGAAFSHNFALASSAKGSTANGRIAVLGSIVILVLIGLLNSRAKEMKS